MGQVPIFGSSVSSDGMMPEDADDDNGAYAQAAAAATNNNSFFDTEQYMYVNSKSLFIWFFEAVILKGCFMVLTNVSPTFLELLSYTGYKFVPLCLIVMT